MPSRAAPCPPVSTARIRTVKKAPGSAIMEAAMSMPDAPPRRWPMPAAISTGSAPGVMQAATTTSSYARFVTSLPFSTTSFSMTGISALPPPKPIVPMRSMLSPKRTISAYPRRMLRYIPLACTKICSTAITSQVIYSSTTHLQSKLKNKKGPKAGAERACLRTSIFLVSSRQTLEFRTSNDVFILA